MHRLPLVLAIACLPSVAFAQLGDPMEPDEPMEPRPAPDIETPVPAVDQPDPPPPPAANGLAGYKKGFFIESADGKFKVRTQLRLQTRFQLDNEKVVDEATGESSRETSTAFSLTRARIKLLGHAFSKDITYKIEVDLGKGDVTLKDYFVDYKIGTPMLRFGQYKRPFNRQQINSSSRLEHADRSITDRAFGGGRDIGIMIHNNYEKSPELEWAVGLFNGTGDKGVLTAEVDPMTGEVEGAISNVPSDIQPAFVGRVGINRGGIKGYSEADLEGGPTRFAVAGSVMARFDNDGDDQSDVRGQVDGVLKNNGLSASGAVFVGSAQDGTGFFDQAYQQVGFYAQAGYMLNKTMQPGVRYSLVSVDEGATSHEISGAFSIYKIGHKLKWQSDVSLLGTSDGIADEVRARTQVEISF